MEALVDKLIATKHSHVHLEANTLSSAIDLKGFTEHFYQHQTLSHLEPVLDTLRWIRHESSVWLEITNLVIPGANDDPGEIRQMCEWMLDHLGTDVPHPNRFVDAAGLRHRANRCAPPSVQT